MIVLAFASVVIYGFSLLEIHAQKFYSLLDLYTFRNGPPLRRCKGSVFLWTCYVFLHSSFSTSIFALSRCPGQNGFCAPFVTALH
jgi:hypothetical protein